MPTTIKFKSHPPNVHSTTPHSAQPMRVLLFPGEGGGAGAHEDGARQSRHQVAADAQPLAGDEARHVLHVQSL